MLTTSCVKALIHPKPRRFRIPSAQQQSVATQKRSLMRASGLSRPVKMRRSTSRSRGMFFICSGMPAKAVSFRKLAEHWPSGAVRLKLGSMEAIWQVCRSLAAPTFSTIPSMPRSNSAHTSGCGWRRARASAASRTGSRATWARGLPISSRKPRPGAPPIGSSSASGHG